MTTCVTAKELKEHSSDVLGKAQYGKERIVVTKHSKQVAAVVSMDDVQVLERLEDLVDVLDALEALDESEREGNISLADLRRELDQ